MRSCLAFHNVRDIHLVPPSTVPTCLLSTLRILDCEDRAVRARGFKALRCHPSLPLRHPSSSSYSAPDKAQWLIGKQGREVAGRPQRGFHGTWLLSGQPLPSTESICSTNHRHTVTSFFPVLIFLSSSLYYFTPLFCFRQSERL